MSEASETTHVAVRINEASLLKNLRYAFSNRYTIVSELMQNARRAGATYVAVDYSAETQTLSVADNGCGIDDFQKLFTFGESGWDETTVASETAFGLGFTKSLYAASHCTVWSRGRVISFDTRVALAQQPIAVHAAPDEARTEVILKGVLLPELDRRISVLACGFPIQVIYNGVEQARPYAVDQLETIETSVGRVHLRGHGDGEKASRNTVLFLQGFVVHGEKRLAHAENIVHLAPMQFRARLPDRDVLIDADEQVRRVDADLKARWRELLLRERARLSPTLFTEQYFDAARSWGLLDLFDDVPVLPGAQFDVIGDYPYQEGYGDADYLTPLARWVTREEIVSGQTRVVALDAPSEENLAHWMYARARGWLVFSDPGLSEAHWIQPFVTDLEQDEVVVEIQGEQVRADLQGAYIWPTVVLCESYTVCIDDVPVSISNEALYDGARDLLLVPQGECSGQGARQVSSFIDESDHWHEDDQEHDQDALVDLIHRLRETDPARTLCSLLAELRLARYPHLTGKSFKLVVQADAAEPVVELMP